MAKLAHIEGIGEAYSKKLEAAGISSPEQLLKAGATPAGRKEIAQKAGISDQLILQWINHVDLYRVKGIGSEYADLLEAAGVDTVPELAQRNPDNLYKKMLDTNEAKKLVRRPPSAAQVADWVAQAKKLPRVIQY
jgi:predicted flap endonuclease-1-like 5' DNA nuclease